MILLSSGTSSYQHTEPVEPLEKTVAERTLALCACLQDGEAFTKNCGLVYEKLPFALRAIRRHHSRTVWGDYNADNVLRRGQCRQR